MKDEFEDYRNKLKEAEDIKNALKLEKIDTALLLLLLEDIETIRFHNSD